MGTNYYLQVSVGETCPHCGHKTEAEQLHIGKSSAGWCFALHVIPERGLNELKDWEALFAQGGVITDEYGERLSSEEMTRVIANRLAPVSSWDRFAERHLCLYPTEREFHCRNHSERGPNGLLRSQLGGNCIGHGIGTWDLITGEFS